MTDIPWTRAAGCESSSCVEVAFTADGVLVRSSNGGPAVCLSREEWAAFVGGVKLGEFDLPEVVVDGD